MSASASQHVNSNAESEDEPDEDPKVMLLVEAGRVPGLDDNLQHLRHRYKKKKKKKTKRRKQLDGEHPKPKRAKHEHTGEDRYVLNEIISNLNKPTKYEVFQNCLMLSEWLVKVPADFEDNWIIVPCPAGKRMLVIAASGSTRCFAKSGDFMFYFQSALPGGHLVGKDESSKSLTILDCIWHHKKKTYYVLDVLSWNNSHFLHCEAKFRFFWLQQKIAELSSNFEESDKNHYHFSFLPRTQCKKCELADVIENFRLAEEFQGNIDGVLFYDQSAPYFSGTSSTVGWLKPFMIPEVFELDECSGLLVDLPSDYINMEQYMSEFEKNKKQIIKKERKLRERRLLLNTNFELEEQCMENENITGNEDVILKVVVEGTVAEEGNVMKEEGKIIKEEEREYEGV